MGAQVSSFAKEHMVPLYIDHDEHPTLERRLKSVAVIAAAYYGISFGVLKPVLRKLFSLHPQWVNLGKRRGTFNPDAQDEVLYVTMSGLHHVVCASLMVAGLMKKGTDEDYDKKKPNSRGLVMYGALLEYAFEWTDFALMIMKAWPYQERDPAFTTLIVAHHLLGMCTFSNTSRDIFHKTKIIKFMIALLGMAGLGCLVYPVQQLLNFNTKSGLYKAIALNSFNMVFHVYVRFYLWFTRGMEIYNVIVKECQNQEDGKMYERLQGIGMSSLTVFNVLILLGLIKNQRKYLAALSQVKA